MTLSRGVGEFGPARKVFGPEAGGRGFDGLSGVGEQPHALPPLVEIAEGHDDQAVRPGITARRPFDHRRSGAGGGGRGVNGGGEVEENGSGLSHGAVRPRAFMSTLRGSSRTSPRRIRWVMRWRVSPASQSLIGTRAGSGFG